MRIGMQSLGRTSEQYPLVTHLFPYFPANSAYQAINNGCNRFMGGVLIEIEHLQVSPKEAWTSLIEIVRFFHFVTPDDRRRIEISFSACLRHILPFGMKDDTDRAKSRERKHARFQDGSGPSSRRRAHTHRTLRRSRGFRRQQCSV